MLDLTPIKARLQAVSAQPWRFEHNHSWFRVVLGRSTQGTGLQAKHLELLAHAAQDLQALVEEVERLRESAGLKAAEAA